MALKDILVVVDDSPVMAHRVDVAVMLAQRHDAHVTGLYVSAPVVLPAMVEAELPGEVRALFTRHASEQSAAAGGLFEEKMRQAGLFDRSEWRVAHGHPTDIVAVHGRYADMVVIGQTEPHRSSDNPAVLPQDLLFECGRPILVVPHSGRFNSIGERILVGWNGSREAARAINDAMGLLKSARKVTVLAVNPLPGRHGLGDEPGADIARHLARHGVTVDAAHIDHASVGAGDAFLNHAADASCDLIVMGAYGRSRFREMVLGGMTHYILNHMTVPVVMSH